MLMCLGDVSGSWEGGSGASSWAQRQQRLPAGRGRPFSGLRGSRSGQGGGGRWRLPQPAWVDGRPTPGSRRPAPAAWICKPRCCPLAPMPATSPMARIISHWRVSGVGSPPSSRMGVENGKVSTSLAKLPGKLYLTVLGDKICSLVCLEGKRRGGDTGQHRRGRKEWRWGRGTFRNYKGW